MKVTAVINKNKKGTREIFKKIHDAYAHKAKFSEVGLYDIESKRKNLLTSDLLIILGGDGTTLKTVGAITNQKETTGKLPPLFTVNFGKRGKLSYFEPENTLVSLGNFFSGKYSIIEKKLGKATINNYQETRYFLNEISIIRHYSSSVITFELNALHYNHRTRGDGVIISTETGSSAYAYSAGGPKVVNVPDCLIVVGIAAESRPEAVVIGKKSQPIKLNVKNKKSALNLDGALWKDRGPFSLEIESTNKSIKFISNSD